MPTSSPLLDLERFNTMGIESDPTVMNIFRRFLDLLPGSIESIRNAHDAGDWGAFRERVHRLRGASATCCFLGLSECLAEWDNGDLVPGEFDLANLSDLASRSSEAMARLLST